MAVNNSFPMQAFADRLRRLEEGFGRIEAQLTTLTTLTEQGTVRDWYTTKQVAEKLRKKEYTVREWCRLGRIGATKLPGGRGNEGEWRISHEELERYQNEGLLPLSREAAMRY